MYQMLNLSVRSNRTWDSLKDTHVKIHSLLSEYDEVLVNFTVDDSSVVKQIVLSDLLNVRTLPKDTYIDAYINTFIGILTPLSPRVRDINRMFKLKQHDVWDLGLAVNRGNYNQEPEENIHHAPDVVITKGSSLNSPVDMLDNYAYLVNGVFHPTQIMDDAIYLLGAVKDIDSSSNKSISVLDFTELGGYFFSQFLAVDITIVMSRTYESSVHIKVPDMSGYTPILVLDGRCYFFTDNYKAISTDTIQVTVNSKDVVKKTKSRTTDDISWIKGTRLDGAGFDLSSFDVIRCLADTTSGIIYVKAEALYEIREVLGATGFNGRYVFPRIPNGILLADDSTIMDYRVTASSDNEVEVSCSDSSETNYNMDTIAQGDTSVDASTKILNRHIDIGTLLTIYKI